MWPFSVADANPVQDKEFNLVLSAAKGRGGTIALAKKLEKHGVDVLLPNPKIYAWARDEFFFQDDGHYLSVQKASSPPEAYGHEAYHGGKILKGDGFLVASDSVGRKRRKKTVRKFGFDEGFFYDIAKELNALSSIKVSGNETFYGSSSYRHIDAIFNLGNRKKSIFTYSHPKLLAKAKEIRNDTGYDIVDLPLSDAEFASVGFVEIGDSIVMDCRAKESAGILKSMGYNMITTPKPLTEINQKNGSLRCITAELPVDFEKLEFYKPGEEPEYSFSSSDFTNTKGMKLKFKGYSTLF
ncbi:MAG: hypothetical protein JW789_04310 [Candidatus Aenigmarchaeota archaeon]|nr:hypothetical protein [Candidatus Aenigmarchaeota archaeon]